MTAIAATRSERGIALVIALLVLIVMSLVGMVLMSSVVMNRGATGNDLRMRRALNIAEAGVGEAMARIGNDQTNMPENRPNAVCQVFNVANGSVPALGTDSTGVATAQASGSYLEYSTAARSPDALTIHWKKNPAGTAIMRYDASHVPVVNDVSGLPIYVIESTGRVGNARRSVVVECIQKPINANCKAALAARIPIDFIGTANVCGYNHRYSTAVGEGNSGRNFPAGGAGYCADEETGSGDLTGAWSEGGITVGGAAATAGSPANYMQNQTGFYNGPWEAFGMSQSDFWSWVGAPVTTLTNPNGITYLDADNTTQNSTTNFALHSVTGEGFLYVDGGLRLNAGFTWRGLIYVEGDFDINGHAWILGGIIVKGQTIIRANGTMTILYSSDAISQTLAKYGGQFVTLNWREK